MSFYVVDEIKRWSFITPDELKEFYCSDGLLNEFKMLWHFRLRFPLHYTVFKQLACHLPHEANVEQYFSRAGNLSDPNMSPEYLGVLVMVGCNKKRFSSRLSRPSWSAITPSIVARAAKAAKASKRRPDHHHPRPRPRPRRPRPQPQPNY